LEYFNSEIDKAKEESPGSDWNVGQMLEVVRSSARSWKTSYLRTITELKFTYEEEQSAEQFFVPVVWTLIVGFSGICWNADSILLFSPQTPTASAIDSEEIFSEQNGTGEV